MKQMMYVLVAACFFCSCTNIDGDSDSNTDSLQAKDPDNLMIIRDESITEANAYSDLFLDSSAIESYILKEKISDVQASQMRNFYKIRNYQYAWFATDGPTEQVRGLWSLYASEGDNASKEPAGKLREKMDTILQKDSLTITRNDSSFVQTELILTNQLIQYSSEHPDHISGNNLYYLVPAKKHDALQLADLILNKQKDAAQYAKNRAYGLLKQQLTTYYNISKNGGWQTIPPGSLMKGTKSPGVVALKKRLALTNEYSENDTTNVFSNSLESAVKIYQQRNGLQPSGMVNDSLISLMNVPVEEKIEQIIVNMNRALWMPPQSDSNYLQVNIPSYMLYAYEGNKKVFEMPVIVGKEGTNTVMFSGDINEIVLNPSWKIPASIVKNEIMPAMKKDPNYLKKNNMELTGNNESIPTIRQLPGKDNALGKMKFLFPNTHDIYLHDTPNKNLFAKKVRALSHGCIRLADAKKLAAYLLRDQSDWTPEKIQNMNRSNKEEHIKLKKTQPVSLTYFTAWVDETGVINFRSDVYGHDKNARTKMFNMKA
ncbi:MAG: L,D-transpeptidase family protein [Flavisolibacter sp.]